MSTSVATRAPRVGRNCPVAAALELIGDRWALLIVREIMLGSTRFGSIVRGTGAPRDRVAARLQKLEEVGVLTRVPYQQRPRRDDYVLTTAGQDLRRTIGALFAWGTRHVEGPFDTPPPTYVPTPASDPETTRVRETHDDEVIR